MRIVQLGPMPPPHGGVSTNMLAIHETLVSLGHESTIIDVTNRKRDHVSADLLKPRSALGLIRTLLRLDCDIVHYHIGGDFNVKLALLTLLCGLLPGKKSVVTFHSGGAARHFAEHAKPGSIRGIAFRSIDLLIGVSEQMIVMFKAFGAEGKRVRLIRPFELKQPDSSVSLPPEIQNFADKFKPFLLSVGALEPEYRQDFLIKAMPSVVEQFPDAGLMVVGSGSREAGLRREIADSGVGDRIMIAGNLQHPIVLHLIAQADALFRVTEYDGDSIAVREALFLGTPVIASDNAYRPDGVLLLERPLDPDNLVQRLITAGKAQFSGQLNSVSDVRNAERVVEAYKELLAG